MTLALFNDRPLLGPRTGVGQYLTQILAHWPADASVHPVGVIARISGGRLARAQPAAPAPRRAPPTLIPLSELRPGPEPDAGMGLARRAFQQGVALAMHAAALGGRVGVVFEPNHIPPARVAPTVTTIHDLSVLELPACHPPHRVRAWERGLHRAIATTDTFVCVSHATAAAMTRVLGVPPDRLRVIHLAGRWERQPAPAPPPGLPERYCAHLGTIEPRKNLGVLLDALASMTPRERRSTPLVLVGRAGWGSAAFWSELLGHPMAEHVLWAGFAADDQARAIVANARALVCPSLYEGFGLPALEAMRLGVPAVVSTAPSLVEVAADAAPALDPADAGAWALAMLEAGAEGDAREHRIARGLARAADFSWDRAAREHERVLAGAAGAGVRHSP